MAIKGPAAGFVTIFPDALTEAWDDTGLGRVDGADDVRFIATAIDELVTEGVSLWGQVILVGLSNGAYFAEHLARHGLVRALGIVLVAGTSRARPVGVPPSRQSGPVESS